MTNTIEQAAASIADPAAYADEQSLYRTMEQLRRESPVTLVDVPAYRPFYAIARHADVIAIERDNLLFTNASRPVLMSEADEELQSGTQVRTLLHMDGADHLAMRSIGTNWFRPKALRRLQLRIEELASDYVDRMRAVGPECDFVQEIAVNYPLHVIMSLIGVPESDFPRMLKLTQEMVGSSDSEFQRSATPEENMQALLDMFEYFTALAQEKRRNPTDDFGSAIANARINGQPLSDIDTTSYFVTMAVGGHDTTSATIAGGMRALVENPDQRQRFSQNLSLAATAADEMVRWVTPIKGFMRTARADATVNDVRIPQGESVFLCYVSANRDEEVFTDADRFDVTRHPNRHLGFGHGAHFCLGATLARMEISSFFCELLPRLTDIELAGQPELVATTFIGGLKHLPLRYRVT
ncbi:cytochrome P450 [Nocardia pseudovaccinii]|uniref:cytochrome P450 n=1 Tax=Nocardia pseudovaccinii TaxID=189540 RepID=UPI0007A3D18D|nr:cytochrome P450 [Nocardia pseudovaccinii]